MSHPNVIDTTKPYGAQVYVDGRTADENRTVIEQAWIDLQAMSHADRVRLQNAFNDDYIVHTAFTALGSYLTDDDPRRELLRRLQAGTWAED